MLNKLADTLEADIEKLVVAWGEAVRRDPRIKSDAFLSQPELYDHTPAMLEEICELIRAGEEPNTVNARDGRVHIFTRYANGYRGRDLVAEISLLRVTLLDHLAAICLREDFASFTQASRIINLYLDEELRYAVSVYTEAGEPSVAVRG